jgi:hypothetical protein
LIRPEILSRDEHSSLFGLFVSYEKSFTKLAPEDLMKDRNKFLQSLVNSSFWPFQKERRKITLRLLRISALAKMTGYDKSPLSVSLSVCLSIYLSLRLIVSFSLLLHLSLYLSLPLSLHLFLSLSLFLSFFLHLSFLFFLFYFLSISPTLSFFSLSISISLSFSLSLSFFLSLSSSFFSFLSL